MKRVYHSILVIALAFTATACFNEKQPNYQYFPDMYTSPSYEAYGDYEVFPKGQEALKPVEGTMARGETVFEYPHTLDGKLAATKELKNPLPFTKANAENGKALYDIYCAICHGKKGDGQGPLMKREKILGIPGFDAANRDIVPGNIYYTMYYGLNNMGSYASQLTTKESWQIVQHVMILKASLLGTTPPAFVKDTTVNSEHFDQEITPVIGRSAMLSTEHK